MRVFYADARKTPYPAYKNHKFKVLQVKVGLIKRSASGNLWFVFENENAGVKFLQRWS
ncbi:hypothetical protein ACNKHT_10355 [Shigella flexneri]